VNGGGEVTQVRCLIRGDAGTQEVTVGTLARGTSTVVDRTVFATHLPMLRPSVGFSIGGMIWASLMLHRHGLSPARLTALVFFAIPTIVLNQQIATGVAIIPWAWEIYVNYPLIIVGAGPVGVELASSLRDLMDHTLRRIYPTIDFRREVTIHLLDSADRVIQQMDVRLSRIAMKRLASQRVNVVLRTPVSEIAQNCVRTKDGVELRGRTIVWSGGVKANPLLEKVALPKAKDGRILVDEFFRASGRDDVLALGDAAYFEHAGRPLPLLAQVAVLEAPAAARNIEALVRGEPLAPFVYKRKGDLVALGRRAAGAELAGLGGIVMGGLPAWTVWRANYLMQLLGARNRGTLLVEWVLSYFAGRLVANTP